MAGRPHPRRRIGPIRLSAPETAVASGLSQAELSPEERVFCVPQRKPDRDAHSH
jgi:hypothetical protein